MCVQETVPPPTAEAAKHVQRLRTLMFFQIGVGVVMLIMGFPALNMLLMALMLYMTYDQLSVCSAISYIFFTLFDTLMFFSGIGKSLQNSGGVDKQTAPIILFTVFLLLFDIVAIYLVFSAYKEFKAVWQEMGGGGGGMGPMSRLATRDNEQPSYNAVGGSTIPTTGTDFKAFTGKGIALG